MIAVVQRVTESSVTVGGTIVGAIGPGLNVLLGVAGDDKRADANFLATKIPCLRIFEDDQGKMNRSLVETGGKMLVISQFTLLGNCRKGRRPSFIKAAKPPLAEELYETFIDQVRKQGVDVKTGRFGARMKVNIANDGPVTLLVQSR
jgi:D-tyrosyl-tRNA(Tyr) deacylase